MSFNDRVSAAARMAQLAIFRHELAVVSHDELTGGWLHRYRDGAFVSPRPRGLPWRRAEEYTYDIFFHDYTPVEGDTVLELGAEYGTETVTISRLVGSSGRVIAVEANPWTCDLLRRTIEVNNLQNVTVVNAAVTGAVGDIRISDDRESTLTNSVLAGGGIKVEAITIDALVTRLNLARIDLLKVNIEGAERDALDSVNSSRCLIQRAVISCHDFITDAGGDDNYRTSVDVDRILEHWDFSVSGRPEDSRPWVRYYKYAVRT